MPLGLVVLASAIFCLVPCLPVGLGADRTVQEPGRPVCHSPSGVKLTICFLTALTHSLMKAKFCPKRPITPRQFQVDHGSLAALTWKQGLGCWRNGPLLAPGLVGADITLKPQAAVMECFRTTSALVAVCPLPLQKGSVMLVVALLRSNPSLRLGVADLVRASAA